VRNMEVAENEDKHLENIPNKKLPVKKLCSGFVLTELLFTFLIEAEHLNTTHATSHHVSYRN
jgi:hypothetical protein